MRVRDDRHLLVPAIGSCLLAAAVLGLAIAPSSSAVARVSAAGPATSSPEPRAAPAGADAPSTSPTPTATATALAPPTLTLAFAGDVHGERQIARALQQGDHPLAAMAPVLSRADVAVVNLETAVGSSGRPSPKRYVFQAEPLLLDELVAAGVDVVSVANNHALDHGPAGLAETLALARARDLATVGGGDDAGEAYRAHVVERDGLRVAVLGLTRVLSSPTWAATSDRAGLASAYDVAAAVDAVRRARAEADVVVVTVHWGTESQGCPDPHQRQLDAALRAAGATVVVGHHPHVLQGIEAHGTQLTAFSLGNFLWYTRGDVSRLTGVLTVEVGRHGVVDWGFTPGVVAAEDGGPRPADERDAALARHRIERLVAGDLC